MTDPTTPAKGLIQPTVFDDNNAWGSILDADLSLIDQALGGTLTKSISGNVSLTSAEAQNGGYKFTGALIGTAIVTFPPFFGFAALRNSTTGGFSISCGLSSGASVTILSGDTAAIWSDGTGFIQFSAQQIRRLSLNGDNGFRTWSGAASEANTNFYSNLDWSGTTPANTDAILNWFLVRSEEIAGDQTSTIENTVIQHQFGGTTAGSQNRNLLHLILSQTGDINAAPGNGGGNVGLQIDTKVGCFSTAGEGPYTKSGTTTNGSFNIAITNTSGINVADYVSGPGQPLAIVNTVTANTSINVSVAATASATVTLNFTHYGGAFWAMNPRTYAVPALGHADIYPVAIVGSEWNPTINAGGHTAFKMGIHIAPEQSDTRRGDVFDAALVINRAAANAAPYWKYGIAFSKAGVGWAFTDDSTIIGSGPNLFGEPGTSGAGRRAGWGIDFSDVVLVNGLLNGPGFSIDGSGNILAPSLQVSATNIAAELKLAGYSGSGNYLAVRTTAADAIRLKAYGSNELWIEPPNSQGLKVLTEDLGTFFTVTPPHSNTIAVTSIVVRPGGTNAGDGASIAQINGSTATPFNFENVGPIVLAPGGRVVDFNDNVAGQAITDWFYMDGGVSGPPTIKSVFGSGVKINDKLLMATMTAPATPAAGSFAIYMSAADNKLHAKGPSGTDTILANP